MTDPTPFLATIASSSAALVAIVGGLLVARFVGLDSQQQGAQTVLDEAQDRLAVAQRRALDAADRLVEFEALGFRNAAIFDAIQAGTTDMGSLRPHGERTNLTNEELQPFIDRLADEFVRARSDLDRVVPEYADVEENERPQYMYWSEFERQHRADLPEGFTYNVWSRVFDEVIQRRSKDYQEWKQRHPQSDVERMFQRSQNIQAAMMRPFASSIGIGPQTDYEATSARRHDELQSLRDRTHQQVEDIEGEILRLKRDRDRIVKPDGMFWWGITILVVFSAVGVIAPLWAMIGTPLTLTPHLRGLFWAFAIAFATLVGYFVVYGWRLTRRKKES